MNVVSTIWSRFSDYYRTLNPATLSGAIDIIVVRQPDGSLRSSPFHARFGKTGILRPKEDVVELYVNDELIPDLHMQLGEAGEAFFLVEEPDEVLPPTEQELLQQKILDEDETGSESNASSADPTENELQQQVSYYSDCESAERGMSSRRSNFSLGSRKNSQSGYKSDSDLPTETHAAVLGPSDQVVAQMNWEWGQLPQSATMDSIKSGDYFDCNEEAICDASSSSGVGEVGRGSESERLSDSVGECYLSELDSRNRHLYLSGLSSSPESGYKSDKSDAAVEEDLNIGVRLSLCGGLDGTQQRGITTERFLQHLITYEEFMQNPDLVEHKELVVRINGKNYNWKSAAPLLLCRAAYGLPLPHRAEVAVRQRHMPFRRKKNSMRYWFPWGSSSSPGDEPRDEEPIDSGLDGDFSQATPMDPASDNAAITSAVTAALEQHQQQQQQQQQKVQRKRLTRTVRLSSSQLERLNLRPGFNDLRYSATTKYQGTTAFSCGIYLWNFNDRLVISDIDGTITKSDVLGHILPMVGKDWTQPRVARLFSAIERNDYKFVYLSARAIGQSSVTRRFLQRVRQEGIPLPDGPVLLSPQSLLRAFHQEVIAKRPEQFKIACLKDVAALYPEGTQPFWAGFGNRPSDTLSYSAVGVPSTRRFTVNPQGEVKKENSDSLVSSYEALSEVADLMFPPLKQRSVEEHDYSQFVYWRQPLSEFTPSRATEAAETSDMLP